MKDIVEYLKHNKSVNIKKEKNVKIKKKKLPCKAIHNFFFIIIIH